MNSVQSILSSSGFPPRSLFPPFYVHACYIRDQRPLPRVLVRKVALDRLDAKSQGQQYGAGSGSMSELENQLRTIFVEADVDHSGYLSTREFKQVWTTLR